MSTLKKRSHILILLLFACLSATYLLTACSKSASQHETQSQKQATSSPQPTAAPTDIIHASPASVEQINEAIEALYEKADTLLELGQILANEMADGYFDYVTKLFADNMHDLYCIESLMTVWNNTIEDYGDFLALTDAVQKDSANSDTVYMILQYEHNNLLVGLTFNKEQQIIDLSLKEHASSSFQASSKEP